MTPKGKNMGRYIFDIFADKQPTISLPLHLVIRKRGYRKTPTELNRIFLTTLSANSYDDAISKILDYIKSGKVRDD